MQPVAKLAELGRTEKVVPLRPNRFWKLGSTEDSAYPYRETLFQRGGWGCLLIATAPTVMVYVISYTGAPPPRRALHAATDALYCRRSWVRVVGCRLVESEGCLP